jgi:hypothetical protein
MEKYPLYIKSVDYGDIDANGASTHCVVTYADDSVVTYTTEEQLKAVHAQLAAQVYALNAGEVISFTATK